MPSQTALHSGMAAVVEPCSSGSTRVHLCFGSLTVAGTAETSCCQTSLEQWTLLSKQSISQDWDSNHSSLAFEFCSVEGIKRCKTPQDMSVHHAVISELVQHTLALERATVSLCWVTCSVVLISTAEQVPELAWVPLVLPYTIPTHGYCHQS